jgi:hypothetical protein
VFILVKMSIVVCWVVTSLVFDVYKRFEELLSEDGVDTFLCNVGNHLQDCMA